jgi:hypothetical protein
MDIIVQSERKRRGPQLPQWGRAALLWLLGAFMTGTVQWWTGGLLHRCFPFW